LVALVVILALVVALLAVLVAGLLRSHADILKALHDLGAGVGDPALDGDHTGHGSGHVDGHGSTSGPLTIGPPLPGERASVSAPTIAGVTPEGDARAIAVGHSDQLTLIAFLSSGCSTCAEFWAAFGRPEDLGLPDGVRPVVVTKGPELEIAGELRGRARVPVIMSTEAWGDYEVPGSPFFVLVDGRSGRRIGEGVANHFAQVAELVRRAEADAQPFDLGSRSRPLVDGLDGPERELANDRELLRAGILPGDPSLYPSTLDGIYGPTGDGHAPVRRAG
jgi:hypothetical protein